MLIYKIDFYILIYLFSYKNNNNGRYYKMGYERI